MESDIVVTEGSDRSQDLLVEIHRAILEGQGYEVEAVHSGLEALPKIREFHPDVIVLDVMMEQWDSGFAVARQIRADHHAGHTPKARASGGVSGEGDPSGLLQDRGKLSARQLPLSLQKPIESGVVMSVLTIWNQIKEEVLRRREETEAGATAWVVVGMATCGMAAGAGEAFRALEDTVAARGLKGVRLLKTGCVGRCDMEPMVEVVRQGEAPVLYCRVTPEVARRIVERHLEKNEILLDWVLI